MSITQRPYGHALQGQPVTAFTLTNAHGAYVTILDFGGIITHIAVPDRQGVLGDVTLGFDDAQPYTGDSGYLGALVGRVGNRIAGAAFQLEGKTYALAANDGPNNLHGGADGYHVRMWQATPAEGRGVDSLTLTLTSPDGDQHFPGTLALQVTYTFDDQNALGIAYRAVTDQPTLVNLTNHAYFNLDGHDAPDVRGLTLQVLADFVTEVGAGLIPNGKMLPQQAVAYGFETPKRLGDVLAQTQTDPAMKAAGGVDFNYCAGNDRVHKCIAVLYSPATGREMRVMTDLPGVQVYTGQGLHYTGKGGAAYGAYSGMCLETQRYPDAIHHPHFPSIVLRPGEVYLSKTEYIFGVR